MNSTFNSTDMEPQSLGTVFLISGTFVAVICPLTILANVLLLVAIYKDPFSTFRTPTGCFLVGLAITDLVTGLVPEPMVTSCYFAYYHDHPAKLTRCPKIFEIAGIVAAVTTNASFLIVMAFTFAQYVAVAFPLKYKRLISVKKTLFCVATIWLYLTLFELSRTIGVPQEVLEKIDLYLHSTFSLLFTIITYVLLQTAFHRQMTERSATLHTTNTISMSSAVLQEDPRKQKRKPTVERKFVRLNLLLIVILLVCSLPSAILWYIYFYAGESTRNSQTLFLVRVTADNTLYLKFFLDPFVFAWRLPKYRKALKNALCTGRNN